MSKELIEFFQDIPVRKIEINGEWWVSAVDTAKAIGYANAHRDATRLIGKNANRFEGYSTVSKLGSVENGRFVKRNMMLLNLKGVIAFCMLSDLPNAIPFQRWADKILAAHIEAAAKARKQKYGAITEKTVTARKLEVSEWQRHGAQGKDYRDLTLLEYELLGFDEDKRKGNMAPDELLKLTISNLTNTYQLRKIEEKVYKPGIEKVMNNTKELIDDLDTKSIGNVL